MSWLLKIRLPVLWNQVVQDEHASGIKSREGQVEAVPLTAFGVGKYEIEKAQSRLLS